ncbi:MAG: transposase family protein [Ostreibacterium sp.]
MPRKRIVFSLKSKGYGDGIMDKASRRQTLTQGQKQQNNRIKQHRYVIEQCFGTLKRRFGFRLRKGMKNPIIPISVLLGSLLLFN